VCVFALHWHQETCEWVENQPRAANRLLNDMFEKIVASLRVELDCRKRASLKIMGHFQVVRTEIQSDGQQTAEYIPIRKQYAVRLTLS
jgi:hypothetical protein